jgi:beta-N-acetylhexosaminidase
MLPLILGLSGLTLTKDERAFLREANPAGFILFGRNVEAPAQLRALTDALRDLLGRDLPILIDQEGGRVARLKPPHWPAFPPAAAFGALYRCAPISGMEAARVNAAAIGAVLAEAGINVDCAPSLDLAVEGADAVIGDRALGSDPLQVAALGRMVLDGLAEAGVAGVIKHMPGHGRAGADSHKALPVVDAPAEALEDDLAPFAKLAARAKWGMTAHIRYPAWDGERPATLSPTIIADVIRGRIGFEGLLLTDDITMSALEGSMGARASAALAAGCDLVLHCSGDIEEAQQIAPALPAADPTLSARIAAALPPALMQPPDLAALLAKRDALLAQVAPA